MANGKNKNSKDFFTTTGAMPNASVGGKVLSEVLRATGIKKHVMRTASTITLPLVLLVLCMLPSIVQALSVVSSIGSIAIVAFFAYRMLGAKGTTSETDGILRKSRRTITAEELEARKARAYSFGNQQRAGAAQSKTRTMTVN